VDEKTANGDGVRRRVVELATRAEAIVEVLEARLPMGGGR
jgi:hypothetical protein